MSDGSSLGERMKSYEAIGRSSLVKKIPVIARLDGKAFHTFTRGMDRPYDNRLASCMQETMLYLCRNIQGVQVAYQQSDEITLLLVDYQSDVTSAWFEYRLDKMASVSASYASTAFMAQYMKVFPEKRDECLSGKFPAFDARFFNIPQSEVMNCFIWRQQDATRNSIQMLGQSKFSHKQLHGKSCDQIQDMLMKDFSINWNDCPVPQKRGVCAAKESYTSDSGCERTRWVIDNEIPIFTRDREYIERFVYIKDDGATP